MVPIGVTKLRFRCWACGCVIDWVEPEREVPNVRNNDLTQTTLQTWEVVSIISFQYGSLILLVSVCLTSMSWGYNRTRHPTISLDRLLVIVHHLFGEKPRGVPL